MKKVTLKLALALCTGVFAAGVSTNAFAQTQQTGQITAGNLIAALNNISVEINDLQALNDLTVQDIRVVNVEDVLNGNNVEALNNSLNRNDVEVLTLQDVLNNNEVIKNALNNNNVAVSDVVAIDVLSGGDVVVFSR